MQTHFFVTCVTILFLKIYNLVDFIINPRNGRSADPFLPTSNVYCPCLLLYKFCLLHFVLENPSHLYMQQRHRVLPNYPVDFFLMPSLHILTLMPSPSKPSNICNPFQEAQLCVISFEPNQHFQANICECMKQATSSTSFA